MILADIRQYMRERRQATLTDIALHFHSSPEAVRGMLDYWVRKGLLSRQRMTASCNVSCTRCAEADTEIYSWITGHNSDAVSDSHPASCSMEP